VKAAGKIGERGARGTGFTVGGLPLGGFLRSAARASLTWPSASEEARVIMATAFAMSLSSGVRERDLDKLSRN
jgi:hypothetical protein